MILEMDEVQEIYMSWVNGQKKQMVRQIDEFNNHYDFWSQLKEHIDSFVVSPVNAYSAYTDIVISYFRIKNR